MREITVYVNANLFARITGVRGHWGGTLAV
jgi:hypothetical protein